MQSFEEICQVLKTEFGEAIEDTVTEGCRPYAVVSVGRWGDVAKFLRNDPRMRFDLLRCISAIDLLEDDKLACVYELGALSAISATADMSLERELAVRVITDRTDPHIASVAHLWAAADWHEREAFDMMGIVFDGHPNLERILCPEDWVGYPLRKDYKFPLEYHGIPATTEHELTSPKH
ncbi:MAG: NADH-quinone oxidoreductase subunit C [Planctomycetes bacterium]|nr:NADH-quinone oxidoreductase subunit C [Planctomycetota bacterium]